MEDYADSIDIEIFLNFFDFYKELLTENLEE